MKRLKDEGVISEGDILDTRKMNSYVLIARAFGIDLSYGFNCSINVPYSVCLVRDHSYVKPERCKSVSFSNEKFISFVKGKNEDWLVYTATFLDLELNGLNFRIFDEQKIIAGILETHPWADENTLRNVLKGLGDAGIFGLIKVK